MGLPWLTIPFRIGSDGYNDLMQTNWPQLLALIGLGVVALYVGGRIVAKIDDLRVEIGNAAAGLVQNGTDLNELIARIADNAATGDPTDADVAAVKAIADGLVALGGQIDAVLAAPAPDPVPEP